MRKIYCPTSFDEWEFQSVIYRCLALDEGVGDRLNYESFWAII